MKYFKKFTIIIIVLLFISLAFSFLISPSLRFIAADKLEALGEKAELTQISAAKPDFTEIELKQLEYGKSCEFNQALMLINSKHPLSSDFEPELEKFADTEAYLNTCAVESFSALREHIKLYFDDTLFIMSSYRDGGKQAEILSQSDNDTAAQPGQSEHEAGLGIDVYVKYFAGSGFIKSEVGQYVNKNCGDFGFIIRYPFGKKNLTGFAYEPWHIRYVGLPHSQIIEKNSITLEEYIQSLEIDCFYSYENYVISKQDGETVIIPSEYELLQIFPDNCGNYIVTAKIR